MAALLCACRLGLFLPFVLCCGGDFATTSTARSKRAHALGASSDCVLDCFRSLGADMSKPPKPRHIFIKPDPSYWRVLGNFVEAFANLEAMMFQSLKFHAGVDTDIARALFSGTRVDAAMQYIRRIWEVRPIAPGRKADMENMFAQIKLMSDLRNKIIHYGTFVTSDKGRITSTIVRALTPDRVEEHRASKKDLNAMIDDIRLINTALAWDYVPLPIPAELSTAHQQTPALLQPWKYKPEQPTARQKAAQGKKVSPRRG